MTNKEIWEEMKKAEMAERAIIRMIYGKANKEAIIMRVNGLKDLHRSLCLKLIELRDGTTNDSNKNQDVYTDIDDLDLPEFMVRQ